MAQAYRCRPSEILQIDEPLTAFYLDRAVHTFGGRVQQEIDSLQGLPEQKQRLKLAIINNKWLGMNSFASPKPTR